MVFGDVEPDHQRCRRTENCHLRVSWGCDEAAREPVFETGCSCCDGGDPDCKRCEGEGTVLWYRCPTSVLQDAPIAKQAQVMSLFQAYSHMEGRHLYPVEGGLCDQSKSFLSAVAIIDHERGMIDEERKQEQERERKRAEARAKAAAAGAKRKGR